MSFQLLTASEWDEFLSDFPDAHLLQTSAWGELKADFGWEVARLAGENSGAQVLFRSLPLGFTIAYIPKGPLCHSTQMQAATRDGQAAWAKLGLAVDELCRSRRAVFLKVEPDQWENGATVPPNFQPSSYTIQPRRTLVIDLEGDEERVLARMKQKTRYNIRLALRKGVVVRHSADLETFHRLMQVTGGRDSFGIHSLAYYRRAYELFHPQGACELLFAEFEEKPLAGLMAFAHGRRAWYFYGASGNEHRERMPTYLLQWEAMRWARERGCTSYDLWGIPDEDEPALEAGFTERSDGLWGVYRFKRGFGGELRRSAGPWDRVYHQRLYSLYKWYVGRRGEE